MLPVDVHEVVAPSLPTASTVIGGPESGALSKGITVLGHFPEYLEKAEELGARRFNIPGEIWAAMTEQGKLAAETKFLDRLAARSDVVVLSNHISTVRPGSWLAKEIKYLLSNKGYSIGEDGLRLVPPLQ
jgi:hypothetical protein